MSECKVLATQWFGCLQKHANWVKLMLGPREDCIRKCQRHVESPSRGKAHTKAVKAQKLESAPPCRL